jgi:hypothetical protein
MALCTTADVEALIQTDITDDSDPMLVNLIGQATEAIESELGREAEAGSFTEVLTLPAGARDIFLPHWPLASVDSVDEDGITLVLDTDYRVDLKTGVIRRLGNRYWSAGEDIVSVTYTTVTVPGLRTLCAALVVRAYKSGHAYANTADEMAGLTQLTVGQWSATREAEDSETRPNPIHPTDRELETIHSWHDRGL